MTTDERVEYFLNAVEGLDCGALARVVKAHFLAVEEAEREGCAKAVEDHYDSLPDTVVGLWGPPLLIVAELIRARSNGGEK